MNTTKLKLLALICMFADHIAHFFPNVPEWFHWIGRIAAPLFMFCMVWGIYYTKDKKAYLKRLYTASVLMALSNALLAIFRYNIDFYIFSTIFAAALIIMVIDYVKEHKQRWKILLIGYALIQILSTTFVYASPYIFDIKYEWCMLFSACAGNIFMNEGGFMFVLLSVLLYYTKNSKITLSVAYISWCISYVVLCISNIPFRVLRHLPDNTFKCTIKILFNLITQVKVFLPNMNTALDYRWMVIFALPFMLIYNQKKGKGYKYLFYVFYPLHIYILFFLSKFLHF